MEVQMNGIRNVEVFNHRSACSANHKMSSSCGDLSFRSTSFEIQRSWIENFEL